MAEQEQDMERVNEELTDLRGNIGQIMEMLQVIRAKMDTQPTIVSEIVNPVITPQPAVTTPVTWPPFGLPYGFVPPPQGQSTRHTVPLTTEVNQVIPLLHPLPCTLEFNRTSMIINKCMIYLIYLKKVMKDMKS